MVDSSQVKRNNMKWLLKRVESLYAAVAFAEAGEFNTARTIIREEKKILMKDDQETSLYKGRIIVNVVPLPTSLLT